MFKHLIRDYLYCSSTETVSSKRSSIHPLHLGELTINLSHGLFIWRLRLPSASSSWTISLTENCHSIMSSVTLFFFLYFTVHFSLFLGKESQAQKTEFNCTAFSVSFYKSATFLGLPVVSESWQHVSCSLGFLERNGAVNRLCGCTQLKVCFGSSKPSRDASKKNRLNRGHSTVDCL